MSQKTIYHGGAIFTLDGSLPRAEAVFVENGIIKAVGDKAEVYNLVDAGTRKTDLHGGFLVPGLIESHNHLSYFAIFLEHCYLGGGACESIDDAVRLLKNQAARSEESEHIAGYGFDDTYTPALRHLNKDDLDRVSKDKPVLVFHMSGHVGYLNSRGLEFFGISETTENPQGGWIERDDQGNPTGKLDEMAWFQLVGEKMPPPTDPEKIQSQIKKAVTVFNKYGVVAVHDAAVGIGGTGEITVSAYQELEKKRELNMRAFLSMMVQSETAPSAEQIDGVGMGKRRVVAGGVKHHPVRSRCYQGDQRPEDHHRG